MIDHQAPVGNPGPVNHANRARSRIQAAVDNLKVAAAVLDFVCEDNGTDERSRAWYGEYTEIQGRSPYETNPPGMNLFLRTLGDRYRVLRFTPWSRQKLCGDVTGFTKRLKENIVAHKGDMKARCSSEAGTQKFFDDKSNDLLELTKRERGSEGKYETKWACREYKGECQEGKP
ncbi:hypothetical protein ACQPW1_10725 [Nocardia sp. CA-128927]|uniref:hypothetical protein n=1 Tax=Nocardia sp. CA-128927 TaxID=3239975 RepID=UPI003D954D06